MAGTLLKREQDAADHRDAVERLERVIEEWAHLLPVRAFDPLRSAGLLGPEGDAQRTIRMDEFTEGEDLVIRAELPGVDIEKDVTITLSDHRLTIDAERREESESAGRGFRRRELRYGHFTREVGLPEGVAEQDVAAQYADGILEIRVHLPEDVHATRIPITTTG